MYEGLNINITLTGLKKYMEEENIAGVAIGAYGDIRAYGSEIDEPLNKKLTKLSVNKLVSAVGNEQDPEIKETLYKEVQALLYKVKLNRDIYKYSELEKIGFDKFEF